MTVATGFDVDYYLDQVGADYYLTAAGEPPGVWAGQGAAALGLRGQVGGDKASAGVMRALFHYGTGPDGIRCQRSGGGGRYPAWAMKSNQTHASKKDDLGPGRCAPRETKVRADVP